MRLLVRQADDGEGLAREEKAKGASFPDPGPSDRPKILTAVLHSWRQSNISQSELGRVQGPVARRRLRSGEGEGGGGGRGDRE